MCFNLGIKFLVYSLILTSLYKVEGNFTPIPTTKRISWKAHPD